MEGPISNLVSYVCPSCGGRLETDDSRKLMVCRSCGNVYDYDYFFAENLLKAADKALAHKNYSAAKDMYMFMLDKEPSNVKALKGFLLAKNNVNRFYDITKQIREGSFVISAFDLEKYRNESDPEASRFFEKTDRVMALYKDYLALKKALKNLERKAAGSEPGDTDYGGGLLYYSSAGTLKIAVRSASSGATDRNMVLTQDGTEIFNQIIKENESTDYATVEIEGQSKKVFPIVSVEVEAGTVNIAYPTSSLNFYAFILEGSSTPTGIENVQVAENENAPMYNLAGQQVDKSFKGVVIQNGKKFINK